MNRWNAPNIPPYDVECPACFSQPGTLCAAVLEPRRDPHTQRVEASRQRDAARGTSKRCAR